MGCGATKEPADEQLGAEVKSPPTVLSWVAEQQRASAKGELQKIPSRKPSLVKTGDSSVYEGLSSASSTMSLDEAAPRGTADLTASTLRTLEESFKEQPAPAPSAAAAPA